MMMSLVIFTLFLFGDVLCQFEEKKSVPVRAKPSRMCENGEPEIVRQPEPLYLVKKLGDSLKVECVAYGLPSPLVYWVKGKMDLTEKEERIPATGVGASILYFDSIDKDDIDYYTCVVEDCCRGSIQLFETEIRLEINAQCTRRQSAGYFWTVVWDYKSWPDAKKFCESHNMELAVPKNEWQNEQLHGVIKETMGSDPNGKKFAHHNMVWMGISDGVVEGGFSDVNTRKPISYSNWLPKQPDNWKFHDEEGQDVVAMDRVSGEWDDSYGFWKRPFACYCPPRNERGKKKSSE